MGKTRPDFDSFKEGMKEAGKLIKAERYQEAREKLAYVRKLGEHPKLDEWLAHLDKVDPVEMVDAEKPKKKRWGKLKWGAIILFACCGLTLVAYVFTPQEIKDESSTRVAITQSYRETQRALPTETATDTPVPSETPLPSATPTITNTPAPTSPPTVEELASIAFADVFGQPRVDEIATLIVNDIVVTLRFPLTDFSAWSARREAELEFPNLVCALREQGLSNRTYQITGTIGVIDSFGNSSIAEGVETIVPASVVSQINCEAAEMFQVNLANIAERYDVNPLIQE